MNYNTKFHLLWPLGDDSILGTSLVLFPEPGGLCWACIGPAKVTQ